MKVLIAWDGDHIGREVGRASLADDVEGLRRISQAIDLGNNTWRSWIVMNGGSVISMGGDEGRAEILAEKLPELPKIREQYAEAVGASVSVGVGTKLSEADRALIVAKLRGGNRIVLYTDDLEDEIKAAEQEKETTTEADKLTDEYLGKAEKKRLRGPKCPDCAGEPQFDKKRRTGKCDVCGGTGRKSGGSGCDNCEGTGSPVCCRCEGTGIDLEAPGLKKADPSEAPAAPESPGAAQPTAAGFQGAQPQVSPGNDQPQGSPDPSQDAGAAQEQGAQPQASTGDAGADFESAFHDLATQQQSDDQGQAQQGGTPEQLKAQVVQILQSLKQQAPILEQIKQTAPDTYQAVMNMAQAVIAMAKEMNGDSQHTSAKELGDRANSEAQVQVPLPPEDGEESGSKDKKSDTKKSELAKAEKKVKHDCDEFGHCWGVGATKGHCLICGEHESELEKASLSPNAGAPAAHHHLQLPVGSKIDPTSAGTVRAGRIKVTHTETGKQGWIQARAGQVLSQDGHAISARNPNGK
jgi:hypothetical protein